MYYKNYCKILSKFITLAKKFCYNYKLANSTTKPKTTCSIIKTITNNKKNLNNILMMETGGKVTTHHQTIAEKFNNTGQHTKCIRNQNSLFFFNLTC